MTIPYTQGVEILKQATVIELRVGDEKWPVHSHGPAPAPLQGYHLYAGSSDSDRITIPPDATFEILPEGGLHVWGHTLFVSVPPWKTPEEGAARYPAPETKPLPRFRVSLTGVANVRGVYDVRAADEAAAAAAAMNNLGDVIWEYDGLISEDQREASVSHVRPY